MDRFMIRYICYCLFVCIAKDDMFVFVLHTHNREHLDKTYAAVDVLWEDVLQESVDENGWGRRREEELLIPTFYCWAITASGARTLWQFHIFHHPQHLQFVLLDQRI